MIPLFKDEPQSVFTNFARSWFRLLAHGKYGEAVLCLDAPNSYGVQWNEDQIRKTLRDYVRADSVNVTDPDLISTKAHLGLIELKDGRGYTFEHDVPIDGCWSDLTVQFEFLRGPDGYKVVLHDIHVL